jgi:acetylornithine deacetylase/succinyl-diaminopimelate desuccinylase-like protein
MAVVAGLVPGPELLEAADRLFEQEALGVLQDYVRIPCLSPDFDVEWEAHGHIEAAARLLADWAGARPLPGLTVELSRLPGLTPVILAEVPATPGYRGWRDGASASSAAGPVLLYGHLDKQPPLGAWREGLDPFVPVRDGDRFYGRGAADDGYSVFAALGALQALHESGVDHGRCIVIIEASEESGSPHLPAYLEALVPRLGPDGPSLVVCLDSGSPTYDRLWVTTSLRGLLSVEIRVDVLTEGVHSGAAGGVVPSSFRILRRLLDRIEDPDTGAILVEECTATVPDVRRAEAEALVAAIGDGAAGSFPTVPGLELGGRDPVDRVLVRTWAPSLAFVGIDGVPSVQDGGNVLRPFTTGNIAMRLPPSADAEAAAERVAELLRGDPPSGAVVTVVAEGAKGFDAPVMAPWLAEAVAAASMAYYGEPAGAAGEGGTIPFLSALQEKYPAAQFLVTGVLGPESNAHGPNEMLHLPTAKRVTAAVAHVLSQAP